MTNSKHTPDLLIERARQIGKERGPLGACSYAAKLEEVNRDLLEALRNLKDAAGAFGKPDCPILVKAYDAACSAISKAEDA